MTPELNLRGDGFGKRGERFNVSLTPAIMRRNYSTGTTGFRIQPRPWVALAAGLVATLGYAHPSAAIVVADLSITKTASVNEVIAGTELFYNFHVHNYGPDAATDAEMTDELPEGLTYLADTAPGGCTLAGTTLTCDLGTIPNGGNVDF